MKELLSNVPEARLFDEMLKLLLSGQALPCVKKLRAMDLHHGMLPMLDVILEQPMGEKFVMLALQNTDQRIAEEKPVSPAFLFAALLWHEVLAAWKARQEAGETSDRARCMRRWTRCWNGSARSSPSRAATTR